MLPDGRSLEIVVEVDGEAADIVDALQLITEFWRDVGVKLFVKPQDRTILRQRSYSGPDGDGGGAAASTMPCRRP